VIGFMGVLERRKFLFNNMAEHGTEVRDGFLFDL